MGGMLSGTIIGRLAKDPERRQAGSHTVVNFSIPVDKGRGSETTWVRCQAWNKTGDFVEKFFRKGSWIACSGPLVVREWEGQNGKGSSLEMDCREVTFAGDSQQGGGSQQQGQGGGNQRQGNDFGAPPPGFDGGTGAGAGSGDSGPTDDDIPF